MYYRILGSENNQLLSYYHFSQSDNYYHTSYSHLLTYEFTYSYNLDIVTVSFTNVGGLEETAGMNCLFYIVCNDDSNYVNHTLPNADINDFTLTMQTYDYEVDLIIACGYTSEAYFNSYRSEYENGYQNGYTYGYADGNSQSSKTSYDNGYADGRLVGYQEGVASGNDFTGVFGLLGQAFGSAKTLMDAQFIGGLSIGAFVTIPIAITIVIAIFRMLRK